MSLLQCIYDTYTHESIPPVAEIQSREDDTVLGFLVSFGPKTRDKIPIRLELMTKAALEARVQSSQDDGDAVVARGGGELPVRRIVQLDGRRGEGLGMKIIEY